LMILRAAVVLIFLSVAWLLAGRRVTLLVDRLVTVDSVPLPISPLQYEGGGFRIGEQQLSFGTLTNLRFDLHLATDAMSRIVLAAGGRSFVLGPRTNAADPKGHPDIRIVPEPADEVSLTSRRSLLSWPTPFEIRILGGQAPWWKRYVYYQLIWKKSTGSELKMLWRYEQQYYSAQGWTRPEMMWNSLTGLLRVDIQPDPVIEYISRTKQWQPDEYRIESRGPSPDRQSDMFSIVHRDDDRGASPGAGKSLVLYLDRRSRQVTKELAHQ
jgi:hypothetical protein